MTDEYPANSQQGRERAPQPSDDGKPKVEAVVERGAANRRKKPLGKRIRESLFQGDAHETWGDVIFDVLLPEGKAMIVDAFTTGVERMILGDARGPRNRSRRGYSSGGPSGYTPYSRMSRSGPEPFRGQDDRPSMSRHARARHDFDELDFEHRHQADDVLEGMYNLLAKYDQVTVMDFLHLAGETAQFTDDKWGWLDLQGSGIRRVGRRFVINLPPTVELD